jgi:AcrR family transcriptional regulator
MTKTGRRRGESGTRRAIATAAQRQFGERGFAKTTIRSVAEEAGVDPALVMQFFGSKDQLFAQTIRWPFDPAEEISAVIGGDRATAGARLVALFVRTWDAHRGRNPIVTLLRAATTQDSAAEQLRHFLEDEVLMPLVERLECDAPAVRANLVATQLLGLGIARYVLRFQPLAAMRPGEVVALLGPHVQSALTGPLPSGTRPAGA